jgi:hypothetical protein
VHDVRDAGIERRGVLFSAARWLEEEMIAFQRWNAS